MANSFIDQSSKECMKTELELFHVVDTQASLGNYHYVRYYPITSIEKNGPVEILLHANSDTYFDLNESFLFLDFTIVDGTGANITKVTDATATTYANQIVAPVNAFHSSFFRSVEINMNNKLVSQTDNLYPYKAIIQDIISSGSDAKNTFLERKIYYGDEGDAIDTFHTTDIIENSDGLDDVKNIGLAKRFLLSRNSKSFSSFGKIYSELFQQQKLIPGDNEIRIKLHRADSTFCLLAKSDISYGIKLNKAVMYVKQYEIPPHIREAQAKVLQKQNMKFPVKHIEMKFFTKGSGRQDLSEQNLVSGVLPRRCYITLVSSEAFNGKITKNPFNFQNFGVSEIILRKNGMPVPYEKLSVDYTNKKYDEGYFSFLQSAGYLYRNGGPSLTYEQFANGYAIYGFDLSSDPSPDNTCLDLIQEGKLSLSMSLASASTESITIIAYLEYDKIIEIDKDKSVITNYE